MRVKGFTLLAAAEEKAGREVGSACFDRHFGKPAGWARAATGVASRRFIAEGETASLLASRAARTALSEAGVEAAGLSMIIGACGVMEQPIPGFAPLLQRHLGPAVSGIPSIDVNATCLSFLVALRFAAWQLQGDGRSARPVLVASGDIASAGLDPDDPHTAPLFGDGAAAALFGRGNGALLAWRMATYGEGANTAWLGAGGSRLPARDPGALLAESRFRMDGPAAFRLASRHIAPLFEAVLAEAGWRRADIDLVVPHQASGPALEMMIRRLGLDAERVVQTIEDGGNMIASSMPVALARALRQGRAGTGCRVLLIGTGAGLSIGAAALIL